MRVHVLALVGTAMPLALGACKSAAPITPIAASAKPAATHTPVLTPGGCTAIVPSQPWACYMDTITPSPTPLESPTPTSEPSLTPTPPASMKPLIVYGGFGGDGGTASDYYLGRDTPRLILYADGTLLRKECAADNGCQFWESHLQPVAVCQLRSALIQTGFFDVANADADKDKSPIYKFDQTTERSDGAPGIVIQVNGEPAQQVDIYIPYYPSLITPMRRAELLLRTYTPIASRVYEPSTLLLWIERGRGLAKGTERPRDWPSDLPSLSQLWQSRVEGRSLYESSDVALTSDTAQKVYTLFGDKMRGLLFHQEGIEYYLIARPLLPHETPERISPFPYPARSFPFPFDCSP